MPENTPARRPLRRRSRAVAALAAATAILGGSLALAPAAVAAEAPPTIGAVTLTAPAAADEGDTVEVVIAVDASADVFAYELAVTYDPALLALVDGESTFPTGGFDAVADDAGTATFTHTRLGTSPGLSGAQELVTFSFTALGGGTAEIAVSDATFLSASGTAIGLPEGAVVSATTALTAAPEPPSPSPTPTSSATTSPVPPTGDATPAPDTAGPPLAVTGQDAAFWIVLGVLAAGVIAVGVVIVLRRRAVTR
ncbi:MAG: hypothetical protein J0H70_02150 [Microbacterium chocolatum]|nr:hypothetical protein [Microbacterium chocolatum]